MTAIYNENNPYAAQWIRNLVDAGHVAPGVVDERSIKDISDVDGHGQRHFFAGIAVWSYALRAAGWPDSREVWTGSCPCQPWSDAGAGKGFDDPRHLWPDWFKLIDACRPAVVLGEQVASKDGLAWVDLVRADLEGAGYAFGVLDSCAAGYGAPHIRQRFYFAAIRLADDDGGGLGEFGGGRVREVEDASLRHDTDGRGEAGGLADAAEVGRRRVEVERGDQRNGANPGRPEGERLPESCGEAGGLGDTDGEHARGDAGAGGGTQGRTRLRSGSDVPRAPSATNGWWSEADWLLCRDEPVNKWRPVKPGTFPLAHGTPQRVGRLRAYGNAIVAPQAIEFIKAVMAFLTA